MGYKIHRVLWKYSVGRVIPFCPVGVDGVLFEAGAVALFKYHFLYELFKDQGVLGFLEDIQPPYHYHHSTSSRYVHIVRDRRA